MGNRIWGLCKRRDPVAPSVRVTTGDKIATPVILTFLRDPRVGKMFSLAPRVEQFSSVGVMVGGGEGRQRRREWPAGRALKCIIFSLFFLFIFLPSTHSGGTGERKSDKDPTMASYAGLWSWEIWSCIKGHRHCFGSGGAAAMALRASCSGISDKW